MNNVRNNGIPKSVISRFTGYLTVLQQLRDSGDEWVSSKDIAESLNLTSSTVRQDLSHINFSGISKRGYEIVGLEKEISDVLGLGSLWNVAVIGAGNLGCALARYSDFPESGFNIIGIFDNDKKKIDKKVGSLKVRDSGTLHLYVKEHKVAMAILAVPDSAAQDVAAMLGASGIKGILNFTSTHIAIPNDKVACVDARVVACLQELSHAISGMQSS